MQENSVQLVGRQIQTLQNAKAAAGTADAAADALAALGPFSAIILNLMQDGTQQDAAAQTDGEKTQQDERTLAQNAAELLLAGQAVPLMTDLPQESGQTAENPVVSDLTALEANKEIPLQMPAVQLTQTPAQDQVQGAAQQEGEETQPQITFFASMQQAQSGQEQGQTQDSVLQYSDRQIFEQLRAGQEETKDTKQTQTLDIDALQAQADAQRPWVENQIRMQSVQEPAAEKNESISGQITEQIQQNLERGSNEFTIRLKPEELGEVTVRLVEKEGKMTLQISAANEQTVKLLNGDLAALREAVRPMQVEVKDAVVQSQNAQAGHLDQSFDMSGQFFGNPQQTAQQNQNAYSYSGSVWEPEDVILADSEQIARAAKIVKENLLDIYL